MQIMIALCWFFAGWMCAFALTEWGSGQTGKMATSLIVAVLNAAAAFVMTLAA